MGSTSSSCSCIGDKSSVVLFLTTRRSDNPGVQAPVQDRGLRPVRVPLHDRQPGQVPPGRRR